MPTELLEIVPRDAGERVDEPAVAFREAANELRLAVECPCTIACMQTTQYCYTTE